MFLTSNSHFNLDPSKLGDTPSREPVPADWKIVASFLCTTFFIYGLWTKKVFHVMGFLELRSFDAYWIHGQFIADFNLSPVRFILNMAFFGISGSVLLIQLMISYFQYQQGRKNGANGKRTKVS